MWWDLLIQADPVSSLAPELKGATRFNPAQYRHHRSDALTRAPGVIFYNSVASLFMWLGGVERVCVYQCLYACLLLYKGHILPRDSWGSGADHSPREKTLVGLAGCSVFQCARESEYSGYLWGKP